MIAFVDDRRCRRVCLTLNSTMIPMIFSKRVQVKVFQRMSNLLFVMMGALGLAEVA